MTRLTLDWHLRAIVDGVPDDAYTTGSGKYAPVDGRVCDAYAEPMARDALAADDSVAHLDAVAHDPAAPLDWRTDAEDLLSTHIMERRVLEADDHRTALRGRNNAICNAFIEARRTDALPQRSMRPGFWETVTCPDCGEGEVLYNWEEDTPECHCGTPLSLPEYPSRPSES